MLGAIAVVAAFLLRGGPDSTRTRFGLAHDPREILDALRVQGFHFEEDPGARWVRSQMPALGIGEERVTHRDRRGRDHYEGVVLQVARREDREMRVAVFLCPPGIRQHDPLFIAVDPKDRALVAIPPPDLLDGTGWGAEAFGVWLAVYRLDHSETTPETIGQIVEDGIAIARRALAVGSVR